MNTSSKTNASFENVSQGERVYRLASSLILLSAVLVGIVTVPMAMFAVTVVSIFLGITAIMSLDPLYSLVERLTPRVSPAHHRSGQTYA